MSRPRPQGIRLGTQQNVNQGLISRRAIFAGSLGDGDRNCAMCTAAGVVNLSMGRDLWTTAMVKEARGGGGDFKLSMGDNLDSQVKNIKDFCEPMTGRFGQVMGSAANELGFSAAIAGMKGFPDGTVFAVLLSGGKRSGGDGGGVTHWLNAVIQGGNIEYVDYQASHSARMNQTARSDTPILGITGENIENPNMIFVAFPPS